MNGLFLLVLSVRSYLTAKVLCRVHEAGHKRLSSGLSRPTKSLRVQYQIRKRF